MIEEPTDPYAALDVAARAAVAYRARIAAAETTPTADYASVLASFDAPLPEAGCDPSKAIAELVAGAEPGLRATTSPRFFGWVIGNSHPAGVAADWLTSAWGQNVANVHASPAAAAVEAVAARWLLDLLHLPPESSVGFATGATVANMTCLAAARNAVLRRAGWDVEADGLFGAPPIRVLIGADAHVTVFSSLRYLGLGARRVVTVASDELGRMRPEALAQALGEGGGPAIVVLQAGQINTGASDPFAELVPLAHVAGAWVHVDGAFGLWAQAAPVRRPQTAGVELADSWATDGHKWLQTPYDCGFAIVRDEAAHRAAMGLTASYLPDAAAGERDPSAYVPELSRRARGFATWAMIRTLGREGVAEMVERNCAVAARMGHTIGAEPGARLVLDPPLNQFMIRFGEGLGDADRLTLDTIAQAQADAVMFAGAAQWRGQWVMRVSVTSCATDEAQGDRAAEAVIAAWRAVRRRHEAGAG